MKSRDLSANLPRLGNLVEGWWGVVEALNPGDLRGWTTCSWDGRESPEPRDYGCDDLCLDCTRPEVQALLLAIHRREGQPLDSWFWQVPEEHRAALIRWSTLRLAAGMGAALGVWGFTHGVHCRAREEDCADHHRRGIWVHGYSENQPDPEVPDAC